VTEIFLKAREEVIERQQQEMLELSTPIVKLWQGILALPMIGTLDSARTPIVMETLLLEMSAAKGDEIPPSITNSPSSAPDSAAKVVIGEDEDSFSVFAEKLVNTISLYCDRGSQESGKIAIGCFLSN